jgi:glycosyltransferase involved in cell wall biosynthesis
MKGNVKTMYEGKKVSVIFPTYNEKDSIKDAIEDFFDSGFVDEIIAVNNNAAEGTTEEIAKTLAKEVFETKQGYGYALRRGMEEAEGDIMILAEPDGTFSGHDVRKLLAYSDDMDVVFGTRTSGIFIWKGANMGIFLKWGNFAVGKLLEFLFNTTLLTDVGCTMKLIKRNAYEEIKGRFRVGTSHFGPHLMLLIVTAGIPFVEIPVNYRSRIGTSMVTGSFYKSLKLGMTMIGMILYARLASLFIPGSVYNIPDVHRRE